MRFFLIDERYIDAKDLQSVIRTGVIIEYLAHFKKTENVYGKQKIFRLIFKMFKKLCIVNLKNTYMYMKDNKYNKYNKI